MQQTIDNINYKFIPHKINNIENVIRTNKLMENDIYEKYEATAEVSGELIICKDASKLKQQVKKLVQEDYEMYMQTLNKRDPKKDQWIYNILDGIAEQESVLYRDDKCVVFLNYLWDGKDIDKLHLLCMPTDKNLRTIRSLDFWSLPLLKHMRKVTLDLIKEKYSLEHGDIKMYFHYEPSTYHLHIHFVNTVTGHLYSSVEYSHELNNVMFNLKMMSDYYKIALLNIRV